MGPDPIQISAQQRRGSMSRISSGSQQNSIFNSLGTRGLGALKGSSLDVTKKVEPDIQLREERSEGHAMLGRK